MAKGKKHLAGSSITTASVSMKEQEETVKAAGGTLIEAPETPNAVRNGRMLATYVRPHLDKNKDGEPTVALEISFPLTEEHGKDGLLPPEVISAWKFMQKGNVKRIDVLDITPQTIDFRITPTDPDKVLHIFGATISHAQLAVIEKEGEGKAQQIIRYSFRATVDLTKEIDRFVCWQFDNTFWISARATQKRLGES